MKKLREQQGYVLLWVLFLLSVSILWSSVLLLSASDQYAASENRVQQEQCHLLAYSGWNLALQQLELSGETKPIFLDTETGSVQTTFQQEASGLWKLVVNSQVGACRTTAQGKVLLGAFPWMETQHWPIVMSLDQMMEPVCLLVEQPQYELAVHTAYPLAIGAMNEKPVIVKVQQPLQAKALYIYGDLQLEAPLQAETIYITGEISGQEQLYCTQMIETVPEKLFYQVQVLEYSC